MEAFDNVVGMIPLALVAGIAWKVSERFLPDPEEYAKKRRPVKRDVYNSNYCGDFSNVDFGRLRR